MDYAAFSGIIMSNAVIFVCNFFASTISRCCNSGLAFAAADDFYAQMIDSDMLYSFPCDRLIKTWRQAVSVFGYSLPPCAAGVQGRRSALIL